MFAFAPIPGPALLYGRVSTADQTVETQTDAMRGHLARFTELHPAGEYTDLDTSGATPFEKRSGGGALLRAIRNGHRPGGVPVRHVVAARLDRIGRDAMDIIHTIRWLWEQGVTPHFMDMGPMPKHPMNEAILTVGAAFAQLERQLIQQRTQDRMASKRAKGEATGGTVPFGQQAVDAEGQPTGFEIAGWDDNKGKTLHRWPAGTRFVPLPEEQAIIARMKEMKAAGHNANQIAGELNRDGIPTKGLGRWTWSRVDSVLKAKLNQASEQSSVVSHQ